MTPTAFSPLAIFGKYRELLVAIALFLVLDLGVLAFNFYASRQIEIDTALINAAGELRVYSQQLTKSLLTLETETRQGIPVQTSMTQLVQSRGGFNATLDGLRQRLAAPQGGFPLDDPAGHPEGLELLAAVEKTWTPIDGEIVPLLAGGAPSIELVEIATIKAVARNVRLMQNADDLVRHLETLALDKSRQMRAIQVAAIVLATLNFLFIVFKFLRRLARSDRQAEAARRETRTILDTVHEGLFLVDAERRIGGQRSASLDALFGRPVETGERLPALLSRLFSPADAEAAEGFVEVLFKRRIKPGLIGQLNPLHEVELLGGGEPRGPRARKFLSFGFEQVRRADGEVEALLVTVFDVSQKVRLKLELAEAEERAKTDVELLLGALDQDPRDVQGFVESARRRLDYVNRELEQAKGGGEDYRALIGRILRTVHGVKGEAAALGLGTVERRAHAFESVLQPLAARVDLLGDDLIPVAVEMKSLFDQITRVDVVVGRMQRFAQIGFEAEAGRTRLKSLLVQAEQLALKAAADLHKKVRLEFAAPGLDTLPAAQGRVLAEALPQLVRNAVVHGIERREERDRLGKPGVGTIRIEIHLDAEGRLIVSVRDDGRGLSPSRLRQALVERGLRDPDAVARMSDQDVVATIFESGVTSLPEAGLHGGRGEGLARVRELLAAAGARLRIFSQPDAYTQFLFQLSPDAR